MIYSFDQLEAFNDWWNLTSYGQHVAGGHARDPHWASTTCSAEGWVDFIQAATKRKGHPKLICRHCDKVLEHPNNKNTGSTGLKTHTKSYACHFAARQKGSRETCFPIQAKLKVSNARTIARIIARAFANYSQSAFSSLAIKTCTFIQSTFENQLHCAMVALQRLFWAVNNIQFRKLLTMLQDVLSVPHAPCMQALLDKQVRGIQQTLLTSLQPNTKISIALDAWTSSNNIIFLAIISYFINHNWKLQEAFLGFKHLSGCHTGRNMGRLVDDILIKYNLKKCLFAITTDNASNNKTLHQHVAGNCSTFEQGYHVPCLAHVIQLAVKC